VDLGIARWYVIELRTSVDMFVPADRLGLGSLGLKMDEKDATVKFMKALSER